VARIFHRREINGATLHPEAAYLLLRGMKTLALRVERQNANAMAVARHLQDHPRWRRCTTPASRRTPATTSPGGRCPAASAGCSAFELAGDFDTVKRFLPRLRLAHRAANLGAVETVVAPPRTGSHVELTAEERAALGIPETLVRYSCGIEDVRDLIADLDAALEATRGWT
jgi:cystathionine gamma-synthase